MVTEDWRAVIDERSLVVGARDFYKGREEESVPRLFDGDGVAARMLRTLLLGALGPCTYRCRNCRGRLRLLELVVMVVRSTSRACVLPWSVLMRGEV